MIVSTKRPATDLLSDELWPRVESALCADINNKEVEDNFKILLANTRKALLADTMMQNVTYLPKVVLPLVRRLFPKLIANNVISVQAMSGPMGWVRFLDANHVDKDGNVKNIHPFSAGDHKYSVAQPDIFVNLNTGVGSTTDSTVSSTITLPTTTTSTGTLGIPTAEGTLVVEVSSEPWNTLLTDIIWTKFADVDKNGIIVNSNTSDAKVVGAVDVKTGQYVISFSEVPLDSSNTDARGIRFRYAADFQKNIPFGADKTYTQLQFDIKRVSIEAKERKLGATYSFEVAEDFQAEFNETFENKMVDYLSTMINTEIDGEIINTLASEASHYAEWDALMPATWTRGKMSWYETIMERINMVSNTIYETTHVRGATFLVCSPVTATVLQGMIQYTANGRVDGDMMEVSSVRHGSLQNEYNVLVSPQIPKGIILLGFKGSAPEETGAVYAPYIPVILQPNPYAEGMPSVICRTRYALKVLRPDYYGIVKVLNI